MRPAPVDVRGRTIDESASSDASIIHRCSAAFPFPASGICGSPLSGNLEARSAIAFIHGIPDPGSLQRVAAPSTKTNLPIRATARKARARWRADRADRSGPAR